MAIFILIKEINNASSYLSVAKVFRVVYFLIKRKWCYLSVLHERIYTYILNT